MIIRKEKLRTQGEALRWFKWSFAMRYCEKLGTPKKKRWNTRTEKCDMMNNSGKKKLDQLNETIIRITLCVSFTNINWWQATDFAYYLFFLKRLKREIAQLGKVFHEPPVGFGNNEWIDMKTKEENSWTNHRKNMKINEDKIKKHREELENERRYLREFRYKWTNRRRAD